MGLLGGDSGSGKTYLTAALTTSHSLGRWPFFFNGKESVRDPGHTLIFSAEDGIADTYIPRLMNLGADLSQVHFVDGKRDWRGALHRVVLNDKQIIIRCIKEHEARLVIFDPLQSFLPPRTKMNEMETVRPVLDALIEAAQVTHCHILLVGHLSKARQETAGYKFLGSVDWFNAARSAMLVVRNPENPSEERFFYQVKNSLGPAVPGMGFSISEKNEPVFLWGKSTDVQVEDVFAGTAKRTGTKAEEAETFLRAELSDGERAVDDMKEAATSMHIGWRTMWEVKRKLKIRSHKGKGELAGKWFWTLPPTKDATKDAP